MTLIESCMAAARQRPARVVFPDAEPRQTQLVESAAGAAS